MPDNNNKKPAAKEQKIINVAANPNINIAAFSNMVQLNINHEEGEAIFNFLYVDKNLKTENGEFHGFPVAKVAMTKNHAKKLYKVLGSLLSGKEK